MVIYVRILWEHNCFYQQEWVHIWSNLYCIRF